MNNRRSFLKMLGLSAVAAPAVAKLVIEAEAAPIAGTPIMAEYRRGREILETQREMYRRWAKAAVRANREALERAEYVALMEGEQWTPQQTAKMYRG